LLRELVPADAVNEKNSTLRTNMKPHTLPLIVLVLAISALAPRTWADTLTPVTSPSGLGAFAATDISTLGVAGTLVPSGDSLGVPGIPGLSVTISNVTGNDFQRYDEGVSGAYAWGGNFAPGTPLLWTNSYDAEGDFIQNGPVTFALSSPESGIGFYISTDTYGTFTADLCAYGATDNLLGCDDFAGTSAGTNDDTAPFIGLVDSGGDISSVTVSTTIVTPEAGMDGAMGANDFAFSSPLIAITPEPGTLASLALGLMGLAAFGLRKKSFGLAR
jgi:hypothetical protein